MNLDKKSLPLVDFIKMQIDLENDQDGDVARALSAEFHDALRAVDMAMQTRQPDAEMELLRELALALPAAAGVIEKTWEALHERVLLSASRLTTSPMEINQPWHQQLYRSLHCAWLIAEQRNWTSEAESIFPALLIIFEDSSSLIYFRAAAKAVAGDVTAAHQMLADSPNDERTQIEAASALMIGGDAAWQPVIDRLLACSSDPCVRETSIALRQAAHQFS